MKTLGPYGMEFSDNCAACPARRSGFLCELAPQTLADFQKIKFTSLYPAGADLFVEGQVPRGVYLLCSGRVKLTISSSAGKTSIVRLAEEGELLGLDPAIFGYPHELAAETLHPCKVDFVRCAEFKKFLTEHSDASISALRQLSNCFRGACHRIRNLSLTPSATERMAAFLLESAAHGQETPKGVRFDLNLTHQEIAQVIGLTRESVTRSLAELRTRMLITTKGPSVVIRNKFALEAMIA